MARALRQSADSDRIATEKQSQRLVTTFIASGMIFMLLPGTFLGDSASFIAIELIRERNIGTV